MNLFKRLIASFSMPSRLPVPQQSSVELGMARSCGCWGAPIRRAVVRSFPRATALRAFHLFCQGQLIREACGTSALFAGGLYRRAQCCLLDVRNRALFSRFLVVTRCSCVRVPDSGCEDGTAATGFVLEVAEAPPDTQGGIFSRCDRPLVPSQRGPSTKMALL